MNRHERWINLALKKAAENEKFVGSYSHASVLVKGGRLITIGTNHSKRGAIFDEIYGLKSFHSEADALSRFDPDEIRGASMYVAGYSEHGNVCNSKPCKICQQVIKRYNLRNVYYMDKGEVKRLEIA